MNPLSWLIYLADVAGSLNGVLIGLAVLCAIVVVIFGIISGACADSGEEIPGFVKKRIGWVFAAFVACLLLLALVPERNTVYAIAASELGEQVIKSETGTLAQKALDSWLRKQIGTPDQPAKPTEPADAP